MALLLLWLFTLNVFGQNACEGLTSSDLDYVQRLQQNGRCHTKEIHLTFDDGPMPGSERVLEALNRQDVKATFFISTVNLSSQQAAVNCQGELYDVTTSAATRNQRFIRDLADGGHHIASHGHQHHPYDLTHMTNHASSFYLGEQIRQREIEMSRQLLERFAGFQLNTRQPVLFRMPYAAGSVVRFNGRVSTPRENDFVVMRDEGRDYGSDFMQQLEAYSQSSPALQALALSGFSHLSWNYSSDDWNRPESVDAFVSQQVRRLCESNYQPTVALFHDIQGHTRAGIERIIKMLKCAGMEFIDVQELMAYGPEIEGQGLLTVAEASEALRLTDVLKDGPEVQRTATQCLADSLPISYGQCQVGGRNVPHGSCLWKLAPRGVCLHGTIRRSEVLYQEMCGTLE